MQVYDFNLFLLKHSLDYLCLSTISQRLIIITMLHIYKHVVSMYSLTSPGLLKYPLKTVVET